MSRAVHVSDPGIRLFGKTIHEFELGASCSRDAAVGARGDTTFIVSQETKNKLPDDSSGVRFPELKILVNQNKTTVETLNANDQRQDLNQACSKEGAEVVELVDDSLSPSPKEDVVPEIISPSSGDEVQICIKTSEEYDKPRANFDGEATDGKDLKDVADKKQRREKMIPCPRCNSTETKFCYFNNCNVNQPRHFCRKCQRYWTAGGSMRNIPVGAGRRKSKKRPEKNEEREKHIENVCEPSSSCSGCSPISDPTMAEMNYVAMNYPSCGGPLPWAFYTFQPTDHWIDISSGSIATFTDCDSGNLGKHSRNEAPPLQRSSGEKESVSKMDDANKFGLNMGRTISASNEGGLFKVINLETRWGIRNGDFSKVLFANPAALSRSMDFQECS